MSKASPDPVLTPETFGMNVFFLRAWVVGCPVGRFSRLVGVHPRTVRQHENGHSLPRLDAADRIARAFGVGIEDLWGDFSAWDGWREFRAGWEAAKAGGHPRWRDRYETAVRKMRAA